MYFPLLGFTQACFGFPGLLGSALLGFAWQSPAKQQQYVAIDWVVVVTKECVLLSAHHGALSSRLACLSGYIFQGAFIFGVTSVYFTPPYYFRP